MTPAVVLITIFAYFIVLFGISYIVGHRADNQGFFVGNRKSPWYVVAFAMIGSMISGVTFISVPGMVAASGFSYLQMVLGFVVGQILIAYVLVPLFYKMNLVSIYEYLENRFGMSSYRTGAWFFFISKMLGAAVRLFLVCVVLQLLVFGPMKLPFLLNVIFTVGLVWLYTFRGGVKSLIWTDTLKTVCLIVSVILCIYYIATDLHLDFGGLWQTINQSDMSRMFYFDDVNDKRYFFKQFLAGVFTMIAMNGLDQDMMQRNLSCKNFKDSQKNMITSGISQFFVISLFLMLGVLLYVYAKINVIQVPQKSDELFPMIATQGYFPVIVGILFVGLMLTEDGPKVLEYNARFGDPEAQVVLPRMKNDIIDVMNACIDGKLDEIDLQFEDNAAVCVVLASDGYPEHYEKGKVITGFEKFDGKDGYYVFHAGTKLTDEGIVTNGGRVLGVTAKGKDLKEARKNAYEATNWIDFSNKYMRHDIGRAIDEA